MSNVIVSGKVATLDDSLYDPGGKWEMSFPFALEDYDLTGKEILLECVVPGEEDEPVFRYRSGVDSSVRIESNEGLVELDPTDASQEIGDSITLAALMAQHHTIFFKVDFQSPGATAFDYRFRGNLVRDREYGA